MQKFFLDVQDVQDVQDGPAFQQVFWAWSHPKQAKEKGLEYYQDGDELVKKMSQMPSSARFIFHGMFNRRLWPRLFFSKLPERCSWVCWGAELYEHMADQKTIPRRVAHLFHRGLVKRFANVFALNDGDGELINKFVCQRLVSTLPYPLIGSNATPNIQNEKIILIGNSGNPSNEHIDALKWLEQYADQALRIVLPLNYGGSPKYVKKVCDVGRRLFGVKFHAITHMMTKDEYDQLLADTDVAVFAHRRQQGLYVVYSMLKYGKKLYMRSEVSSFHSLRAGGFTIFDSTDIDRSCFEDFVNQSEQSANINSEQMNNVYSEQALLPRWREQIFHVLSHD